MKYNVTDHHDEVVINVSGRIDTLVAPELEQAVNPFFTREGITLVFDFSEVEYVSSSGLRVVLMAHKHVTSHGGKFLLRNLVPEVRSIIDLTGFSRIMTIE